MTALRELANYLTVDALFDITREKVEKRLERSMDPRQRRLLRNSIHDITVAQRFYERGTKDD